MNLYPYFLQMALDSGATDNVDLNTDTILLALYDSYTYDSTDKYRSDIGTGTLIATSTALLSPTVTDGVFDAADITLSSVPSGHTVTDVIIYKDTGAAATDVLIANIDQDGSASALSLATNGGDITVQFNASGVFSL